MVSVIRTLRRMARQVPILDRAANLGFLRSRRLFWTYRPAHDSTVAPAEYLSFVATELALAGPVFTVIEVGCGDGAVLRRLAAEFPCGSFVGVDVQRAAIAKGQELIAEAGLANVQLNCLSCLDDSISWDCDYLISRTALIYLDGVEIETFLRKRLPVIRRKSLLHEIVSLTGKTEKSHFYANPIVEIATRTAPGLFDVSVRLLDYVPWKREGRWSGAEIVLSNTMPRRGAGIETNREQ